MKEGTQYSFPAITVYWGLSFIGSDIMKKRNLIDAKELFESYNFILLDNSFVGVSAKLNGMTKDEYRYKFQTTFVRLDAGKQPNFFDTRNPYTIYNIKSFMDINKIPYELKDVIYKGKENKMTFVCSIHGEFKTTWTCLRRGHKCKKCSYEELTKTNEQFIEEVYELVGNEYIFLEEYITNHTKIKVIHNTCGHVYKTTPANFLSNGRRCPKCAMDEISGKNHYLYNPNIPEKLRTKYRRIIGKENQDKWRKQVFTRDNYTCKCCGNKGGKLNAHHLDAYHWCIEKRFDVDNGVTLCYSCHEEFHNLYGRKYNTHEQYLEFKSKYKKQLKTS